MRSIINILKILFPRFIYKFDIPSATESCSSQIEENLIQQGAYDIERHTSNCHFNIKTMDLTGRFSLGNVNAYIELNEENKIDITLHFITQLKVFLSFACPIFLIIVIKSLFLENGKIGDLIIIPILLFLGHIHFWGGLAANITNIKKFFSFL